MNYKIVPQISKSLKPDGVLVLMPAQSKEWEQALGFLPESERSALLAFASKRLPKPKPGSKLECDLSPNCRAVVRIVRERTSMFRRLEIARKGLAPLLGAKAARIAVVLEGSLAADWVDPVVSALSVATFELPKYSKKEKKTPPVPTVEISVGKAAISELEAVAAKAQQLADGTNLVRRLAVMAGNELTTDRYVKLASELAREAGLKTEFLPVEKLKAMGAGAFCAVAQASVGGSGILKVHYTPKKPKGRIALVGKGITFDTGGAQLKTGEHMFGMHGDMAGSAVALALALYFAKAQASFAVTSYLAITDNQLSPISFRPNDVVTSLSGKTIEVIDTDAEGRMVLADGLTLASKGEGGEKPQLIVDFATLTGSCVRAIGTMYSGGYSNRKKLLSRIRKAGRLSGERVWAFPNDPDYGRALKSTVADLKQCRKKGGVDHIEASYFLRQFVDKAVPYVHVDLSAIEHEGGLGHVPTESTGFGVRFGAALVSLVL